MSENSVSDMILEKFSDSIKDDANFSPILNDLILAMRQKQGKKKIEELLRKMENENSHP
jgi:hypothetical protein